MKTIETTSGKPKRRLGTASLKIGTQNPIEIDKMIRAGLSREKLDHFQRATKFSSVEVARLLMIPQRTLSRRRGGRLKPDESDRLLRASAIFEMAVNLFNGDKDAARRWLESPQRGLGGEIPLEFARTEVGAREVENLIGCLEHGVYP